MPSLSARLARPSSSSDEARRGEANHDVQCLASQEEHVFVARAAPNPGPQPDHFITAWPSHCANWAGLSKGDARNADHAVFSTALVISKTTEMNYAASAPPVSITSPATTPGATASGSARANSGPCFTACILRIRPFGCLLRPPSGWADVHTRSGYAVVG